MKETGNLKSQQNQSQQYTLDKPNMKHLIRKILREEGKVKALSLKPIDAGPLLAKQNEKKLKDSIESADWELLVQGLEIPEEEFEEPQVIKDLNALIEAIEEGKNDNYLMRTKNFERLGLDQDKLSFWRNHLNKPETKSVWARTKGKIKNWLGGLDKDSTVVMQEQAEGGTGSWDDPLVNATSGDVPLLSYEPNKVRTNHNNGPAGPNYTVKPVSKRLFLKAVELLIRMKDSSWFEDNIEVDDNPWYRTDEMKQTLKILGLSDTGIAPKVFWAAVDNMEGIKGGSITDYNQLTLRAFKTYAYPMFEEARVYKTIYWRPETSAFSEDDATADIIYDEDGLYSSGEWADAEGYDEEENDWESEGAESDGTIFVTGTVYPEEKGIENNLSEGRTKLTEGKCPEDGCVQQRSKGWVVISNDTGKCWGRSKKGSDSECTYYKSEKSANGALSGYFLSK